MSEKLLSKFLSEGAEYKDLSELENKKEVTKWRSLQFDIDPKPGHIGRFKKYQVRDKTGNIIGYEIVFKIFCTENKEVKKIEDLIK